LQNEQEEVSMEQQVRVFVGIDWATEAHQVCAIDASGKELGNRSFAHDGEGLSSMARWLIGLADGAAETVHVGIETPHGAVVELLIERQCAVHSLNPKQMDRFRDRFTVAGAKDDRLDAKVVADALRTDVHCFRRLRLDEPLVVEIREWSRMADELGHELNRLANRMREQLRRYFPQVLDVESDVTRPWLLDLWELVPTPDAAKRARKSQVAALLKRSRIRRIDAEQVLELLRRAPLSVAAGTTEAAVAHIRQLVGRLRLAEKQHRECASKLDELAAALSDKAPAEDTEPGQKNEQHDVTILRSLPGVGRIVLGVLLAEAWWALRARDYHALRALAGAAPITRQSGKRRIVVMRQACSLRLRTAVYHWARVAAQCDPASKAAYAELRKRGHSHGRALRTIADRLLAVACAMLRGGQTYDPQRRKASARLMEPESPSADAGSGKKSVGDAR
jgi:transposase